ncbi:hypothetical protein ACEWY4_025119 [Coilia grayii]|uniref:C2H2-type domain-containing protein n=1 Tax=Coilia grayii TaxID=363190 RepID=A0ABD1IYP8_9TELE
MGTWQHPGERDARCRLTPQVIGCTVLRCGCEGFQPEKVNLRSCGQCQHGWVAHALSKLGSPPVPGVCQVEAVRASQVYDISSLLLFGAQAVPTRMKILLDRLYSVLPSADVRNILHSLGWTLRDYVRGYILQDSLGRVLDRWVMMSYDEEVVTLQQFMRFGETRPIVELMDHQGHDLNIATATRPSSDIRHFIERNSQSRGAVSPLGGTSHSLHQFENLQGACVSLLSPVPLGTHTHTHALTHTHRSALLTHMPGPARLSSQSEHTSKTDSPITDGQGQKGSFDRESVKRQRTISCSACAKTFYDKGTLKIHYNAVHLKIKHGCTVPGCTALFSSLRSRNRHSANPNPRLHSHSHTHHTHTHLHTRTAAHTHTHTQAQEPGFTHMQQLRTHTYVHTQPYVVTGGAHTQPQKNGEACPRGKNTDPRTHTTHTHTYTHTHTHTCRHSDTATCAHTDTHTHLYLQTNPHTHGELSQRHTQAHIQKNTEAEMPEYTSTHTHTTTSPPTVSITHSHTPLPPQKLATVTSMQPGLPGDTFCGVRDQCDKQVSAHTHNASVQAGGGGEESQENGEVANPKLAFSAPEPALKRARRKSSAPVKIEVEREGGREGGRERGREGE